MRVAIQATLLHGGPGFRAAGVNVYTDQLLRHLPVAAPENEYVAFVGANAPPLAVRALRSPFPLDRPALRLPWEQVVVPIEAYLLRAELLHSAVNVLPRAWRGRSVVTVHDLSFVRLPDRLTASRARYLRTMVRQSALQANAVIAVSESTRFDLLDLFGVPPERVHTVYPGVDPGFRPLSPDPDFRPFGDRPYFLHVGTLEPRKNIDVLVRAFDRVRQKLGSDHVLALVGARGWMDDPMHDLVARLGLEDAVQFVGYVRQEDLPRWYNCADLFAYPSAYEGFGLPLLEAMACGVPAITSSSSSLSELAGDACVTVEAGSETDLALAMETILSDPLRAAAMREAGLARAAVFSWDRTAAETAAVYRSIAGS